MQEFQLTMKHISGDDAFVIKSYNQKIKPMSLATLNYRCLTSKQIVDKALGRILTP